VGSDDGATLRVGRSDAFHRRIRVGAVPSPARPGEARQVFAQSHETHIAAVSKIDKAMATTLPGLAYEGLFRASNPAGRERAPTLVPAWNHERDPSV
jgi:hypothetical protein